MQNAEPCVSLSAHLLSPSHMTPYFKLANNIFGVFFCKNSFCLIFNLLWRCGDTDILMGIIEVCFWHKSIYTYIYIYIYTFSVLCHNRFFLSYNQSFFSYLLWTKKSRFTLNRKNKLTSLLTLNRTYGGAATT